MDKQVLVNYVVTMSSCPFLEELPAQLQKKNTFNKILYLCKLMFLAG